MTDFEEAVWNDMKKISEYILGDMKSIINAYWVDYIESCEMQKSCTGFEIVY